LRTTLLQTVRESQLTTFSVIDVGAGSGELLRTIAEWARHNNRKVQLTGVELNARSARAIAEQSEMFSVRAVRANAFALPFSDNQFDYAICSLFLHHFKNEQAVKILRELNRIARREVVVIDLHRHPVSYYFYTTIGRLLFHNRLIREDGALSILRGFKPAELNDLAEHSGLRHIKVLRRFPYRLVLTAKKTEVLSLNQREDEKVMRLAS
jgi:ubiquinone/menaquinone biosynthesis C-methylase UbiE